MASKSAFPIGMYLKADEERVPTILLISGFGPFGDIVDNPTAQILHTLRESEGTSLAPSCPLQVFTILEVSTAGVEKYLESIEALCSSKNSSRISIHLGVDSSATTFKLEKCCYNNCTFRIPDALGHQPEACPIDPSDAFDTAVESKFDLDLACDQLSSAGHCVQVSLDPGRYLCNYVYYRSSCHASSADKSKNPVVFIHVPPFSVIPFEEQVAFVRQAVSVLVQQVCPANAGCQN